LSEPGKVVLKHGITIVGHMNVPSRLAVDASALYARNVLNFLQPHMNKETGNLSFDWEDEIVQGTCLTRKGEIVHPSLTNKMPPVPKNEAIGNGNGTARGD